MAFAAKIRVYAVALALCALLPGLSHGDISGECSQDPESPPARGQSGFVTITTTPEKAIVYLGGQKLGPTPVDTVFPSGRHTLTIMLGGEELVNERVNVCAGQKTIIEKKLLMPYGSIVLTTSPLNCNCKVTIDGEDVGSTRGGVLTINRLEAGTRVLKVSNGKRSKEMSVNVMPEETVDVKVDFKSK
jgi:hypothetical protein